VFRAEPAPATQEPLNGASSLETGRKLEIYGWLIDAVFLISILKNQIFYLVCWSSSRALYKSAFEAVLRAPMRFFDENSNGKQPNFISWRPSELLLVKFGARTKVIYLFLTHSICLWLALN